MTFYAHTAEDEQGKRLSDESQWQLLKDHLRAVAWLAKSFACPMEMAAEAELAGLLHDLGKYRSEFQEYLGHRRNAGAETHHAIYGAALAFQEALQEHPNLLPAAFAVAGHHAGLPDATDLRQNVEGAKYCTSARVPRRNGSIHLPCLRLPSGMKTDSPWSSPPD